MTTENFNSEENNCKKRTADSFLDFSKRFLQLKPSKQLIDFYRERLSQYEANDQDILNKLEQFKKHVKQESHWISEIKNRDDAITDLQKALSEMQRYLYEERHQVVKLITENRILKLQIIEKDKLKNLLAMNQKLEDKSDKTSLTTNIMPDKNMCCIHCIGFNDGKQLVMEKEVLQNQLENIIKLHKEEIETLKEDNRLRMEEILSLQNKDKKTVQYLNDKLEKLHPQLFEIIQDFLNYRKQHFSSEQEWLTEKETLKEELQRCKNKLSELKSSGINKSSATNLQSIHFQLEQTQELADMYRDQCLQMEVELSQLKESSGANKELFKTRFEKLSQKLKIMKTNYEDLQKRQNLEKEGFKNDIKNTKNKISEIEKVIYKMMLSLDLCANDEIYLNKLYQTSTQMKKINGEVNTIKAKIYKLEKAVTRS